MRRWLIGFGVGLGLIGILLWAADLAALKFKYIRLDLVAATVAALLCCLTFRAAKLRRLAPEVSRGSWTMWLRLAARHQLVFMLAPSGVGDVGFPFLARQYTNVGTRDAVRMIAQLRLRDAITLVLLAALGGAMGAGSVELMALSLVVGLGVLYFVENIGNTSFRLAASLFPGTWIAAFLNDCAGQKSVSGRNRAVRVALTSAIWVSAGTAVASVFAAVGRPLDVDEVMLMLAVLNLAGLAAISVGSLGVAEVGVAGVLIGFGDNTGHAAAVALTARPLLLISMVAACTLLDLQVSLSQTFFKNGARH